jgi:hypothetical protein
MIHPQMTEEYLRQERRRLLGQAERYHTTHRTSELTRFRRNALRRPTHFVAGVMAVAFRPRLRWIGDMSKDSRPPVNEV